MRKGAIDGLSIGFRTRRATTEKSSGVRRLHEIDLWEISIVTFPMLPQARIGAVKQSRSSASTHGGARREARAPEGAAGRD